MTTLVQITDERDEYRIRLYGALWMLVEDEVISEAKARELARMSISEFRRVRDPVLERAARALLTRKDDSPLEDAHIFAEWDDLRDALE